MLELESDFALPALRPTAASLGRHFARVGANGAAPRELPNRHRESRVGARARRRATPAAVLIPIVERGGEFDLLFTRRQRGISSPGQICFPGGRTDPGDAGATYTALREAREEIGLEPQRVRVLGRLGDYYSHSGFRIAPVVGLMAPPLDLCPDPREVEEILEVPLAYALRSASYRLVAHGGDSARAHYSLPWGDATITGPTVCILMGLYEELARTHAARPAAAPA